MSIIVFFHSHVLRMHCRTYCSLYFIVYMKHIAKVHVAHKDTHTCFEMTLPGSNVGHPCTQRVGKLMLQCEYNHIHVYIYKYFSEM